ncbi:hypothetical protein FPQ18DRAFT_336200 [Pyronema domesticum]|nr:hypothetical protein FPQ18DRAFT_336200 [Pyronema domesticum]
MNLMCKNSHPPPSPSSLPAPSLPASCLPPSPTNPPQRQVWVIYGATGHLGRSICRVALARGDCVTAIGRNIPAEEASMHGWHKRCQGLVCDVRDRKTVQKAWDQAKEFWGKVDIVVNCTGYGIIGAVEDQDEHDIRAQFETNVTGLINIIQVTAPYFRSLRQGKYIVFSSLHGLVSVPGLGPYCATKWAVEGLTESLMYELEPFNISVTLVEPGPSRRDEPDENINGPSPMWGHFLMKPPTDAYRATTSPAQHATRMVDWLRFRQPTSAVKISRMVWELGHCKYPPLRLLLGSHAIESIRDRLRSTIEEIEDWKQLNNPDAVMEAVPEKQD